ncbi:MAG: rhodanese-like domain-containing protein [Paludibacteraceae bacterium]
MKRIIVLFMGLLSFFGLRAAGYRSVDADEFARIIQDTAVFRLDVRTEKEFAEGHIEGSICIDVTRPDFMEKAAAALPKDKTIALYCRSGRRSKKAAELLSDAGYKVVELNTGYLGWVNAGKQK